jgi:hypothetical protein
VTLQGEGVTLQGRHIRHICMSFPATAGKERHFRNVAVVVRKWDSLHEDPNPNYVMIAG